MSRSPCSAAPPSASAGASSSPWRWPAGTYHWVLAFAAGGLPTTEVYAACDRLRAAQAARSSPVGSLVSTGGERPRGGWPAAGRDAQAQLSTRADGRAAIG